MVSQPQSIDDFLAIVRRRKWSLILAFLATVSIATAIAMLLPPVYRSSATILIEDQEMPNEFVMTTVTSFAEQRLQLINQRIMSSTRLLEIIRKLDLYREMRAEKTTEEVIDKMKKDVGLKLISSDVLDRKTGRAMTATIAFTLSYQGKESPGTIQKVTDTLTSLFLEENLQIRERQTKEISVFLEDELVRQKEDLDALEKKISAFKEQHLNELPEMIQTNLQGIDQTKREIERLGGQLHAMEERQGFLQIQLSAVDPDAAADDPEDRRLQELNLQLVALKTRVSADHPDMKKLTAEIAELESKLNGSGPKKTQEKPRTENPTYVTLKTQLESTENEIRYIQKQLADLGQAQKKYLQRIETTPRIEQQYTMMLLEQKTARIKFDELTRKIVEARVAHNLELDKKGERFTLIDPARLPEKPFKPNRLAIMLIGIVLGIAAGTGLAVIREFADNSVRTADALAAITSLPVLGGIRKIMTQKEVRRRKTRKLVLASASFVLVVGAVVVFHYFVMDLDVFWAKVVRRVAL